jgi:uncharacterized integral membrane protein
MKLKLLVVVLLMLVVSVFSVQNAEAISVHFLHWQFSMSQALVIMLAAFCGGLVGVIAGALAARRRPQKIPPAVDRPRPS